MVFESWFCGSVTGMANAAGDSTQFLSNIDQITCRSWAGTHDSDDVKSLFDTELKDKLANKSINRSGGQRVSRLPRSVDAAS